MIAAVSFLVVSEDSSPDAASAVTALSRKISRILDEHCDTGPRRMRFEPFRNPLPGSLWKSRSPRDRQKRIDLMRTLAIKLLEGDGSFVVYHLDGDQVWANRALSDNVARFAEFRHEICQFEPRLGGGELGRLLLFIPFYSVEAWLYQNFDRARALCRSLHGGRHLDQLDEWERHRADLDEWDQPKQRHCLAAEHNLDLASSGYPAQDAYVVGKSFFETVEQWRGVPGLVLALTRTWQPDPG